jgi:hypothetical protein
LALVRVFGDLDEVTLFLGALVFRSGTTAISLNFKDLLRKPEKSPKAETAFAIFPVFYV